MSDQTDAPRGSVETYFAPIHSAARMRDVDEVKKQLQLGVEVDLPNGKAENGDGGNTALWFAAQGPLPNGIEIARILIEQGANPNRICEHGTTPLHLAALWGHLRVVKFLVENGASHEIADADGQTPFDRARNSNNRPGMELSLVIDFLRQLENQNA